MAPIICTKHIWIKVSIFSIQTYSIQILDCSLFFFQTRQRHTGLMNYILTGHRIQNSLWKNCK